MDHHFDNAVRYSKNCVGFHWTNVKECFVVFKHIVKFSNIHDHDDDDDDNDNIELIMVEYFSIKAEILDRKINK